MALFKKKGSDASPQDAAPPVTAPPVLPPPDVPPPAAAPPGAAPVLPPDLQGAEARLQESGLAAPAPARKKGPSAAVLGGGALALAALAVGAWYFLGGQQVPEDESSAPAVIASNPGPASGAAPTPAAADTEPTGAASGVALRPSSPESARVRVATTTRRTTTTTTTTTRAGARPGGAAATTTTTTTTAVRKGTPRPLATGVAQRGVPVPVAKKVAATRPGRVGIRPTTVPPDTPAFVPPVPGQAPRLAPVQAAPTPVQPRDGLEGIPGRRGGRNEVVLSRTYLEMREAGPLTPAVRSQLKTLWNQGAAAKQRGDYAAARRAWGRILQIRPGHGGIQEAIDKLPS